MSIDPHSSKVSDIGQARVHHPSSVIAIDAKSSRTDSVCHDPKLGSLVASHGGSVIESLSGLHARYLFFENAHSTFAFLSELMTSTQSPFRAAAVTLLGWEKSATLTALSKLESLLSIASYPEILICETTASLAPSYLSPYLHSVGEHTLRAGLPERVFELYADFPKTRNRKVLSINSVPTNFQRDSDEKFVGREDTLRELERSVFQSRLLTIRGPAMIGKSEVARRLGCTVAQYFKDGVFVIDFTSMSEKDVLLEHVQSAIGGGGSHDTDFLKAIKDQLKNKTSLIIFDNADGVSFSLNRLIFEMLQSCRRIHIVVTSRSPLGCEGELNYILLPFDTASLPEPCDPHYMFHESVRFFFSQLPEERRDWSEADRRALVQLCRACRGTPFLIRLATNRLGKSVDWSTRAIESVADEFEHSEIGVRGIEGLVDSVVDSLNQDELSVLTRLAVFERSFDKSAINGMFPEEDELRYRVFDIIEALALKGVVNEWSSELGPRFAIEHAFLSAVSGLVSEVHRESHRRYMVNYVRDLGKEGLNAKLFRAIDLDRANIVKALEQSLMSEETIIDGFWTIYGLFDYWLVRGYLSEGRMWSGRLLSSGAGLSYAERTRALNMHATIADWQRDYNYANRIFCHALRIAKNHGDEVLQATVLTNQALSYRNQGDRYRARRVIKEAANIFRKYNDPRLPTVLNNYGAYLLALKCYKAALAVFEECRQLGGPNQELMEHVIASNQGLIALGRSRFNEAEKLLKKSLEGFLKLGDYRQVSYSIKYLAELAIKIQQHDRAAILMGSASSVRDRSNVKTAQVDAEDDAETMMVLMEQLGENHFMTCYNFGLALNVESAVAYAME